MKTPEEIITEILSRYQTLAHVKAEESLKEAWNEALDWANANAKSVYKISANGPYAYIDSESILKGKI